MREEIPPGRSASSGLRSAVPSAPAAGALLPADRSPAAPYKQPLASFAETLLSEIQGREGSAEAAALFVFGERSLKHSHTLACDYHVLQKCDKAQQLRTLAPPPLGSFAFFPSQHSVSFQALLLLRLTLSRISRWSPLSRLGVELGAGGALPLCGDFKYKRIRRYNQVIQAQ